MAKDITNFSMEELERNTETVTELGEYVTCSNHYGGDIKFYCKDHDVPCCGVCIKDDHKTCKVIDIKQELPVLLCNSKIDEIITDMKKIEIHFMKFMEMNESCVVTLGTEINRLTDQIREDRKKINIILDEIEKQVKDDGSEIYRELAMKKHYENHQCMILLHAVKSSQQAFDSIYRYGSYLQKYLIANRVRLQLHYYTKQVVEKFQKTETVKVMLKLSPQLLSIASVSVSELGKVQSIAGSKILPFKGFQRQTQNCQVNVIDCIDLKVPTGVVTRYTGVTFLPGDRLMLADYDNKQCILLNCSYQFITSHTLTGIPWNVCVIDDEEVAVSFINKNYIQILSVVDDVIRPVRKIPTMYSCNGIASAGKGQMVVNWYCGNNKSQWGLTNTDGLIKISHQYDCLFSTLETYNYCIALNNAKTRVYISADNMNSLICFDMAGNRLFTYKADNLVNPKGVAVDNYDNIYVIGLNTNNIHQLSADGSVLQVVTSGVPLCPLAICIHKSKDLLVITNFIDSTKLNIYKLT